MSATIVWDGCGTNTKYEVAWGTNSGSYQWTNIVTETNIVLTNLVRGVRYYIATTTNCTGRNGELVFPMFPPPTYYSLFAQIATNLAGPFEDISTNVLMRFTNTAPSQFFRLRVGVSLTP